MLVLPCSRRQCWDSHPDQQRNWVVPVKAYTPPWPSRAMFCVTSLPLDKINTLLVKLLGEKVWTLVRYRLYIRMSGFVVGFLFVCFLTVVITILDLVWICLSVIQHYFITHFGKGVVLQNWTWQFSGILGS